MTGDVWPRSYGRAWVCCGCVWGGGRGGGGGEYERKLFTSWPEGLVMGTVGFKIC